MVWYTTTTAVVTGNGAVDLEILVGHDSGSPTAEAVIGEGVPLGVVVRPCAALRLLTELVLIAGVTELTRLIVGDPAVIWYTFR